MPLSRLDNMAPMVVPINTIPQPELVRCCARQAAAIRFRCNKQRYPSASKTTGRHITESASHIVPGAQTRQHMHSGRFAVVPLAHVQKSNGRVLGATANLVAARRY
jgi:hypothetical protein